MELIDTFSQLLLGNLPSTWVSSVIDSDFTTPRERFDDFNMVYDSVNLVEVFEELCIDIKEWLTDSEVDLPPLTENEIKEFVDRGQSLESLNKGVSKSWHSLSIRGVKHRPLLALLSVFIKLDYKELTTLTEITGALMASKLYFMLCSIGGAKIYGAFNSILFGQMVENLKLGYLLYSTAKKNKKKKKKSKDANESQDDDEEDKGEPFSNRDHDELIRLLTEVMDGLAFFLDHAQLSADQDAFVMTVQSLAQLTRIERKTSNLFGKRVPNTHTTTFLAFNAYQLLFRLLSEEHCDINKGTGTVLRFFLPVLNVAEHEGMLIPVKELNVIKDHTINFIKSLIEKMPEVCNLWLKCFIQQLVVRLPEKADIRSKGVQIIAELMNLFPYNAFHFTSIWAMSFVANSQAVKHRVCLLEVIDKLLLSDEKTLDGEDVNSLIEKGIPTDKGNEHDTSTSSNDAGDKEDNQDKGDGDKDKEDGNDDQSDGDKNKGDGDKSNTEAESENQEHDDSHISNIDDMNSSNSARHSSLFECFVGLLFFKLQDASPTIRAKALAIINQTLNSRNYIVREIIDGIFLSPYSEISTIDKIIPSERDIFPMGKLFPKQQCTVKLPSNPLPGGTKVMKIIEILVRDEKVFVRKNALQLMRSLFLLNKKWMTQKRLQMMVSACKDHSVIVRKVLISCLSELVIEYPDEEGLQKCWVEGLMPLMTDNELKLIEKLVEQVENVILKNMTNYSNRRNLLNDLPWKLLNWISKMGKRNLFRFAVRHWTQQSKIDDSIVNTLKTHIGTENNLPAWMFLVCISEFKDIRACGFIIDYFNENILDGAHLNEYSSVLVMEALYLNWRVFKPDKRKELHSVLRENIEKYNIPICLIARVFDISHIEDRDGVKDWCKYIIQKCEAYVHHQVGPDSKEVVDDEETLTLCLFTLSEAILLAPDVIKKQTIEEVCHLIDEENIGIYSNNLRWKGSVSGRVKAEVVTFLGKASLQDQFVAKHVVPVLGTLLSVKGLPISVKINTLIAMSDLCVRFTALVECYLGEMALTLKDDNLQVRTTSLSLFMQLLQEDYLKLKSPFFFYLLLMLQDPDKNIRDQTMSFFINTVLIKSPSIMAQYVVHSLFFFNDYQDNGKYKKSKCMSLEEQVAFTLKGEANRQARRKLYSFMLEHMQDDHRFKAGYRVCTEVLDLVAEGSIALNETSQYLVQDSLYMLACEEMRLAQMKMKDAVNDEESGEMCEMVALTNIARKALVTELIKKNYVDNIMPILIKLRKAFCEAKSPLLRDLMICFRELMKDFKEEIDEILAADKDLAEEVAHDLKDVESDEIENMGMGMVAENMADIIKEVREQCERLSNSMIGGDDAASVVSSFLSHHPEGGGGVGYSSPSTPSPTLLSPKRRSQRKTPSVSSSGKKQSVRRSSNSPLLADIVPKVEKVTPRSTPQFSSESPCSVPKSKTGSSRRNSVKKLPLVETSQTISDTPVVKVKKPPKKKGSKKY